jgi:hypothetical protein
MEVQVFSRAPYRNTASAVFLFSTFEYASYNVRMNKNVLFSILILAIAASGIILLFNNKGADSNEENDQSGEIADISSDIVWDAYSLNGAPFIYPSTWTFAEVKDSTDEKKIIGFTITEPTSLDPRDKIEVGGKCP